MNRISPSNVPSSSFLYEKLMESDAPMIDNGVLTEKRLLQRAEWLHADLEQLRFADFRILPTREDIDQSSGLTFKLVEYHFGKTDHSIENAAPGFPKHSRLIDGTALDRESLSRFAQISEIGHTVIPDLWLENETLRERLSLPTQHLDTLNEVWWLSRWHGIDSASIEMEYPLLTDGKKQKNCPTVDWRFEALGRAVTINMEVKNRPGTAASQPMKKGVWLFGNDPEKPFRPSLDNEFNVLAITGYQAGAISPEEEQKLVGSFLNDTPAGKVIDAVALYVVGDGSRESLIFPSNRPLNKKDIILRAILKPETIEDHSRIMHHRFPIALEGVL